MTEARMVKMCHFVYSPPFPAYTADSGPGVAGAGDRLPSKQNGLREVVTPWGDHLGPYYITGVVRPDYGNRGRSRPSALPDTGQLPAGAGDRIRPCTRPESVILTGIRNPDLADRGRGHGLSRAAGYTPRRRYGMHRVHPKDNVAAYIPCGPLHPAIGQGNDVINFTKRRLPDVPLQPT